MRRVLFYLSLPTAYRDDPQKYAFSIQSLNNFQNDLPTYFERLHIKVLGLELQRLLKVKQDLS